MTDKPEDKPAAKEEPQKSKKKKHKKDKPWDDENVDHWKIDAFTRDDNKGGALLEESSFATLFPQYREQYLKEVWSEVKKTLAPHHIKAELNLIEGSMTVRTTRKTYDPYIILKARDFIKLLARSVTLQNAAKVLDDGVYCDVVKIGGLLRNKERFIKRRQRLVGPNGSTLKAIELLTKCYVMVQGQTVSIVGDIKGVKQVRRIILDCFKNIHPVYHVKELMIKRELANNPELAGENWDRFLPKFVKRNVQRKKKKVKKKEKTLFPPEQQPRKEDLLLESGEYFVPKEERDRRAMAEKRAEAKITSEKRQRDRQTDFVPPPKKARKAAVEQPKESLSDLKDKLKKKGDTGKKKKTATQQAQSALI